LALRASFVLLCPNNSYDSLESLFCALRELAVSGKPTGKSLRLNIIEAAFA
jgi:hypothetical protein